MRGDGIVGGVFGWADSPGLPCLHLPLFVTTLPRLSPPCLSFITIPPHLSPRHLVHHHPPRLSPPRLICHHPAFHWSPPALVRHHPAVNRYHPASFVTTWPHLSPPGLICHSLGDPIICVCPPLFTLSPRRDPRRECGCSCCKNIISTLIFHFLLTCLVFPLVLLVNNA
jgi:hypothetical protein